MNHHIPVILFGDHIAAMGTLRALGPLGIPVFVVASKTRNNLCRYSKFTSGMVVIKHDSPNYFEELIHWGLHTVGSEAVLMVAGADEPLDILSKFTSKFPPGWHVTFPSNEIVSRVRKKEVTYKYAEEVGVPIPKTYAIHSHSDLMKIINNGSMPFPVLMKSERSSEFLARFGVKGVIANSSTELLEKFSTYSEFFGELLLQELIEGDEDNLYCLKTVIDRQHQIISCFGDKKIRSGKKFSSCTLTTDALNRDIFYYCQRLIKKIEYTGTASIEFKYDRKTGEFKLMEINGRISMNHSHSLLRDINIPHLIYQVTLGHPFPVIDPDQDLIFEEGHVNWWYPFDEIPFLLQVIFNRQARKRFQSAPRANALLIEPFSWRDPMPGIFMLLRTGFKGLLKIISLCWTR